MSDDQATRRFWTRLPLLAQRERLSIEMHFSAAELSRVRHGLVPREMEDKWFIFAEGDRLYCCRSWTGVTVYEAQIRTTGNGAVLHDVFVNRDATQYKSTDPAYDASVFQFLVDRLLLGKDVTFPQPADVEPGQQPAFRHAVIGYGTPQGGLDDGSKRQ